MLAERVHTVAAVAAPQLAPEPWYGMPAYARAGKVGCFFRSGQMDGTRYSVLGFDDTAQLDDGGEMWPTSWALTEWTPSAEAEIRRLVERAAG